MTYSFLLNNRANDLYTIEFVINRYPYKIIQKRNNVLGNGGDNIFGFRRRIDKKMRRADSNQRQSGVKSNIEQDINGQGIPSKTSEFEILLKAIFNDSDDLVIETFKLNRDTAMIAYIDGLSNKDLIDRDIIAPLKSPDFEGDIASAIKAIYKERYVISECITDLLNGNVVVFCDNNKGALTVDFRKWDKRAVETPDSETVTRGPKEGFTETIKTNTALIRRKIKNPGLVFENITIGRQTNTQISLAYIKGIVNRDVLEEVKTRLYKIDVDAVLESGNIEQYIEYNTFSPVSGIGITQKPDIAAARMLEGRVAVLCDGTPHVLTIPELFIENLHTSEDYYNRTLQAIIIRTLRVIGLFIGVLLPGLSVAFMTYNPETIPSVFLIHIISSTQKTPLPTAAEAFFLILMFELLKESGTRMPKTVGSAITIVGSLIIGEAAVNAGIVGAPMVIIIALTAVSSFIVPNLSEFILVYRLIFLFFGAVMGLIGIGAGVVIMLTQLISTESFGIPILASFSKNERKDSILRFPLWSMKFRPGSIAKDNARRMGDTGREKQ
jgi:spore germination protein KA